LRKVAGMAETSGEAEVAKVKAKTKRRGIQIHGKN